MPHSLASLEGTNDWQNYDEVFSISPVSSEIRIIAQMGRCSGEFFVKGLSLYEVEETTLYTWAKWLTKSAWIIFVFVLFVPGLKGGGSTLLNFLIVLTVVGIVVGTSLPGQVKNALMSDIEKGVDTYAAPVKKAAKEFMDTTYYDFSMPDNTKIAHFCLFALLAVLLMLKKPSRQRRLILAELLMLACATELMQFYVDGRSPLFTDVLIDMAGGSLLLTADSLQLIRRGSL